MPAKMGYPQSCANAHDNSLCGESLLGACLHAKPPLKGEVPAKRAEGFRLPRAAMAAAALSAAVTTTKPQGIVPTSHGRTSREKKSSLFPATLRERGSGGEVLLLEKQPLPRSLPTYPPATLRERGSGGEALLLEKRPLPQKPPPRLIERLFLCVEAGY